MFKTGEAGYSASGSPNLMGTAGREPLGNGVQTHNVVFLVPKADIFYEVICSFYNFLDSDPIFLQYRISAQTINGFTVVFNAPTDSANYELGWVAVDDI